MPFVKGQSGNPGGRVKDVFAELVRSKKKLPQEIFDVAYALMTGSEDEEMRLKSAVFLKESGWGKPVQAVGTLDDKGQFIPYSLNVKIENANQKL